MDNKLHVTWDSTALSAYLMYKYLIPEIFFRYVQIYPYFSGELAIKYYFNLLISYLLPGNCIYSFPKYLCFIYVDSVFPSEESSTIALFL